MVETRKYLSDWSRETRRTPLQVTVDRMKDVLYNPKLSKQLTGEERDWMSMLCDRLERIDGSEGTDA